jgi:hypothetical protein
MTPSSTRIPAQARSGPLAAALAQLVVQVCLILLADPRVGGRKSSQVQRFQAFSGAAPPPR